MKTIADINRSVHDGETSPMILIEDFFDHVRRDTFEALFAELDPKLQAHVVDFAKLNVHRIEEGIEYFRRTEQHQRFDVWCALKDWIAAQPWYEEEKAKPRWVPLTDAQLDAWMAADYADTLADRARAFQRRAEDERQPDAADWKPIVAEVEETAKRVAARAEAILPKKS